MKALHHWLLLSFKEDDSLFDNLHDLNLLLDSHVTVVQPGFNDSEMVLHELYRIGNHPMITTPAFLWAPRKKLQSRPSRSNFRGISINTALIVSVAITKYCFQYAISCPLQGSLALG